MNNIISNINPEPTEAADPLQVLNNFYRQIVLVKQSLEQHDLEDQVAQHLKINRPPTGEEAAEVISSRLQRWIEKKRSISRKVLTEKDYERIDETLYIAAVLADELFILEIDWPGRRYWYSVLLEERILQSCYAGEQFYTGITKLLSKRVLDEQQRSLLAVYFLALRLGFSGRYRNNPQRLHYVRQQLFKRINHGVSDKQSVVCVQPYHYQFASLQEQRLAPLTRWKRTIAQISLVYILVTWLVWEGLTGVWIAA
ncbi:hypothetical protein AB835_00515 [Candidatus Endobugula sertula]|uniref:Type IV / VI secretion system DotU domain-containing protein n=1 Tax=Candidatus Endobugula sertula TaxID=62101 RepID=A0A1D2QU00_9GAMM|nr:hypothetical protein AB835_00515 [Candidatus Endobugula sertula]